MSAESGDGSAGPAATGPTDDPASRARDHLANERTFLAWVRTALGFMGLGVLIAELVDIEGSRARSAGVLLIAAGGALVAYATLRYRSQSQRLERDAFQAATWGPVLAGVASVGVAIGALLFVLS